MLFTAAILFVGIGLILIFSSFIISLLSILFEVMQNREVDINPKMHRFVIAGVIIGSTLFVLGGILEGADVFLKPM